MSGGGEREEVGQAIDDLSLWQTAIRTTAPGAASAVLLEKRPDFADTDDESEICRYADAVLDSVIARQAMASHQAARLQMDLDWLTRHYPGPREHLATEVAMALGVAEATAGKYLDDAGSIRRLPATFAALDAGEITAFKASVIRLHTEHVTEEVARAVEQRVLPAAGRLTMPELREACTRAVLRIDPDGAEDRHEKAKAGRGMSRRHLAEGMALLFIESSAQDIAVVFEACTALGAAARVHGDERTADQRRIDALTDVCRDILDTGRWNPGQPTPAPPTGNAGSRCPNESEPGVVRQAEAGNPSPETGAKAGRVSTEPDPATTVRTDTDTGTICAQPNPDGAAEPADHSEPVDGPGAPEPAGTPDACEPIGAAASAGTAPADEPDGRAASNGAESAGATGPDAADVDSRSGAAICSRPPVILPDRGSRRPHILVTVPAATLTGGNQPGYLAGHGPITAGQARTIAADGDLTRLICDPTTGALLDYGRTRYRPPGALRDFVHTRDRTCVTPGCRAPAVRTDIDHVEPYKPGQTVGGPTDVDNLASLCRHHHRAKDGGGSRLHHHPNTGDWTWTTALGRTYTRPVVSLWEPADPGEERALRKRTTPPGPTPTAASPSPEDAAPPNTPSAAPDKTPPPF